MNHSDDADPGALCDADQAPDPEAWLSLGEVERHLAVEHHHARGPHAPAPSLELHAAMHVTVENQIAMGTPPVTAATLERLVAEGLTRHEAVHAVAGALSRMLFEMVKHNTPFDPVAYERDLEQISAASWSASAVETPEGGSLVPRRRRDTKRKRRARR